MDTLMLDLLLTVCTVALVLGAAGAGIVALPWTHEELAASGRAWAARAGAPREWMAGAPSDGLRLAHPDELLPAPLPRARPARSRAVSFGHVRAAAAVRSSQA